MGLRLGGGVEAGWVVREKMMVFDIFLNKYFSTYINIST